MGDLKTNWTNPPVGDVGLTGDLPTSRGGDPNVDASGTSGMKPLAWDAPPVSAPEASETANPVSGLPSLPSRFQPSGTPPEPPSLQDRSPSTIDQK